MTPADNSNSKTEVVQQIPMDLLDVDYNFNSRGVVLSEDVQDLSNSINLDGLQSPVCVSRKDDGRFSLIYGFRRHKAFQVLGKSHIPAFVRNLDGDGKARLANLTENIERKQLDIVQEARALKWFFDNNWSDKMISEQFTRSIVWVRARRAILRIPEELHPYIAIAEIGDKQLIRISQLELHDQYQMVADYRDAKLDLSKFGLTKGRAPSERAASNRYTSTRVPTPHEIEQVKIFFYDTFGPSITTKLMAWCGGYQSHKEIWNAIKKHCESEGIVFSPPDDLISRLTSDDSETDE